MFVNEVFKNYVVYNSTPDVRKKALSLKVENLIVGKLGITASVFDTAPCKVNVVLYEGKIHSTSCTCQTTTALCAHIIAVLKAADDLAAAPFQKDASSKDKTQAHPSIYTFQNFSFDTLSNAFILKHLANAPSYSFRGYSIQKVDYNFAEIVLSRNFYERQLVTLSFNNDDLLIECTCYADKKMLCEHQERALFILKDDPTVRVFFDGKARMAFLEKHVMEYGLEDEPNLDDYFKVKLEYNTIVAVPLVKGLISMSDVNKIRMEKDLSFALKTPIEFANSSQEKKLSFIVFGAEKYEDGFFINIMNSGLSKEGKIKNPIQFQEVKKILLDCEDAQEMKFYVGISQFQNMDYRYSGHKTDEQEMASLRAIVKNPLDYPVFCLNTKVSENITSSSIVQVTLKKAEVDLHLKVKQKDRFYEISPQVFVDGSLVGYAKIKLVYKYFLRIDNNLIFCPDIDIIRVLRYLKKHQNKLLIHQSKFEEFRNSILENLESKISIDYTYLKPASETQLMEQGFDVALKKVLYLSESEDYVLLTPVIRYGATEISVRSKRRIYSLDAVGQPFEVARDESLEIQMLLDIQREHPAFEEQEGFEYFYLHKKQFLDEGWFLNAFEHWTDESIEILGFNDLKNNSLSPSKMSVSVGVTSGIDWFDTAIKVKFGEQDVRLKEIQRSLHNQSRFVKLGDGKLGMMPQEWIDKFSKFFRTGDVLENHIRISKVHFSVIDDLFDSEVLSFEVAEELAFFKNRLNGFDRIQEVAIPKKLKAELRDYQKQGLNWLHFLDEFNFGGCLADDMGLGKTIQILAFILALQEKNGRKTHLIVLPTSLLFNWKIEIEKFAPSLKTHTIYGVDRKKDHQDFEKYDIIFTTYGTLLSDVSFLKNFHFDYIFLDESQAIKNPDSKRYKAVRLLQSRNRVVLTGTPIENNTFDLYAQFSFVNPGLLGNQQRFKDNYSVPIDKFKDGLRAKELQQKLHPFLLRRTKKQVASELPDKTEMVIYCEMGKEQRKVYDSYKNEFKRYLQKAKKEELHNNSMHVLQGLMKLRQICNSLALLNDQEYYGNESSKLDELMEQIEAQSGQHKILVFSQFVGMLELIKDRLDEQAIRYEYLTGKTKNRAERVQNFQNDDETRVFLISLKAGGTGLNLTEADYVFIVDPWWNPAVENQAIDRSYRIGQKKNVLAIRLICPDTIEEKIMQLQESKKELIEDLIKVDANAFKSLSKDDLLDLLD